MGPVTATSIEHAKKHALLGLVVDITGYKDREESLWRSEMRYRTVFEYAPDAFIIHDPEGRAIDANPEALKMFGGSSRDEMIGLLSVLETWCEEDRARFAEIREQTFKYGEWRGEAKGYRKDGQVIDFDTRVKVADIEGETVVIAITRDITERKRMEQQIRNALLEKETLLREIHHRVKNNMQIISTLLKLQLRNTDDEKTRALFRESQNRILSMAMIHEKLYQSEGLHKINLNEYIGDLAVEVSEAHLQTSRRFHLPGHTGLHRGALWGKATSDFIIEYKGGPINNLRRSVDTACKRAGRSYKVTMFDIRHLFATTALSEGSDLKAMSMVLGHSFTRMTADIYYHLLHGEKKRAVDLIPIISGEMKTVKNVLTFEKTQKRLGGGSNGS
jgi:PAS domain S-box-containing protein